MFYSQVFSYFALTSELPDSPLCIRDTVRRWCRNGIFSGVKVGHWLVVETSCPSLWSDSTRCSFSCGDEKHCMTGDLVDEREDGTPGRHEDNAICWSVGAKLWDDLKTCYHHSRGQAKRERFMMEECGHEGWHWKLLTTPTTRSDWNWSIENQSRDFFGGFYWFSMTPEMQVTQVCLCRESITPSAVAPPNSKLIVLINSGFIGQYTIHI